MTNKTISSIYGPVQSWRLGKSLGVDLILDPSTCSFNCTYCQLGFIQRITKERKTFVRTEDIINDFKMSDWQHADVITFSGSGEPTLALNLGEVIREIKSITRGKKEIVILTNGTLLFDKSVRADLLEANVISVKLDATNDKTLQIINRPAQGITFDLILSGINKLKDDIKMINVKDAKHRPILQIQIMFMSQNKNMVEQLADLLSLIKPDEVALNTPTRPYPSGWDIVTRGAHGSDISKIKFSTKPLKTLMNEEANEIEKKLRRLTGLKIISVYGCK